MLGCIFNFTYGWRVGLNFQIFDIFRDVGMSVEDALEMVFHLCICSAMPVMTFLSESFTGTSLF